MSNEIIVEKTKELLSGHCAAELRTAAESWLAAIGTAEEDAATEEYIFQLEDGIMPLDDLITFSGSDAGKTVFGEEMASNICGHAKELKEDGHEWCDCPACTLAIEILGLFDDEESDAGRMVLEFDDGSVVECNIVCIFEEEGKSYIVLLPDDDSDDVFIYGYNEVNEEEFELNDLDDEEFQIASDAFDRLLAE